MPPPRTGVGPASKASGCPPWIAWWLPPHPGHRHPLPETATVSAAAVTCRWHTVFGSRPSRSSPSPRPLRRRHRREATCAQAIERYAARWSVGSGYRGRKEVCGTGRARNRTALAIRATVPFTLTCQSPAVIWYATAGHDPPTSLSTRHAPPGMPPTGVHRGQIRGRRPVLCPV